MKKLILLAAIVMLGGCSTLVDSYLMKYDTNEYALITKIRLEANVGKNDCDNPVLSHQEAVAMAQSTQYFVMYTEHEPHNDATAKSAIELNNMAQGLKSAYDKETPVSPMFCKLKYGNIESSAETIQKTVGAKPR